MSNTIQIQELNDAIQNALQDYNKSVIAGLKKKTNKAMSDLVKNTKATAPVGKRTKHYKDSISSKTLSESEYGITKLWYVRGADYRLSHLLNNGHQLKNGGRYSGTNFIGKAVDHILPWYIAEIEEVIKNGG